MIIPSIIAKNQSELNKRLKKLSNFKNIHLDIADGKAVPNTSLWFPFKLSKKHNYTVHLMAKKPETWLKKNSHRFKLCFPQLEELKSLPNYLKKTKKGKRAISINPETPISSIKQHIKEIDHILLLTVHPGFYGAKFLKSPLRKISQIKKLNPTCKITVDGGINPSTIKFIKNADNLISGSFVTLSSNPKIKELDLSIVHYLQKYGLPALRFSLALIFVWFGSLKILGSSPAQEIVTNTIYFFSPMWFVNFLGWWEVLIGLCFFYRPLIRIGIFFLIPQILGTFLPLIILPDVVYAKTFYHLTLEGQYIMKNLVIITAALVIGSTVRTNKN